MTETINQKDRDNNQHFSSHLARPAAPTHEKSPRRELAAIEQASVPPFCGFVCEHKKNKPNKHRLTCAARVAEAQCLARAMLAGPAEQLERPVEAPKPAAKAQRRKAGQNRRPGWERARRPALHPLSPPKICRIYSFDFSRKRETRKFFFT